VAAGSVAFVEAVYRNQSLNPRVRPVGASVGLGGFGGLCRLPSGLSNPLLVAGCHRWGWAPSWNWLRPLAATMDVGMRSSGDVRDTIVIHQWRRVPLSFLDYMPSGKLSPEGHGRSGGRICRRAAGQ